MELRRHQNQNTENSQNLEDHLDAKNSVDNISCAFIFKWQLKIFWRFQPDIKNKGQEHNSVTEIPLVKKAIRA